MGEPRFPLPVKSLPRARYNILADSRVLHPETRRPVTLEILEALFRVSLIQQEMTGDRFIEIPEPVWDAYRPWCPMPLHRARRLERTLNTPAHLYCKNESVSPVGSHRPERGAGVIVDPFPQPGGLVPPGV